MAARRRPRSSLREPILAGYTIEQEHKDDLARMSAAAGVSASAMLDALIEHVELDADGIPVWWERPEELPIDPP